MRETRFILQNKEKWAAGEQLLEGALKDPERLNNLYIEVTDDLSYARTFYPNRSVRVYLNGLAQRVYTTVYQNRRLSANRLSAFWTTELPSIMYGMRGKLALALTAFLLAVAIGALSSAMDSDFLEVILGRSYVDMTEANIEQGDPMAVYKDRDQLGMALGITGNNLFVALLTFAMGLFWGVGALVIIVSNGIMVGAFQYFFISRGLFWESFLTIWIHGTLEMSALVIAGAAGITMGHGLVFPGTYTRLQAFQRSARHGLKVFAGILPIIVLAGAIEAFLTRYTEVPYVVRGLFILASLAFVLLYFVWYPSILARTGQLAPLRHHRIPPDYDTAIRFHEVKTVARAFADTFLLWRRHALRFLGAAAGMAALYCLLAFGLSAMRPEELFQFQGYGMATVLKLPQFADADAHLLYAFLLVAVVLALVVFDAVYAEAMPARPRRSPRQWVALLLPLALGSALFWLPVWPNDWYSIFLLPAFGAFPLLWMYACHYERLTPWDALARMGTLLQGGFMKTVGAFSLMFLASGLFISLVDTFIVSFFLELITWVVNMQGAVAGRITTVAFTFVYVVAGGLMFTLLLGNMAIWYHSLREVAEADHLRQRIQSIVTRREIKGLAREE